MTLLNRSEHGDSGAESGQGKVVDESLLLAVKHLIDHESCMMYDLLLQEMSFHDSLPIAYRMTQLFTEGPAF